MAFLVQDNAVWLVGEGNPPWRMSDSFVDVWLDRLQADAERGDDVARSLFHDLYGCQRQAMGDLFIPRALTLVVDNAQPTFKASKVDWPATPYDGARDIEAAIATRAMERQP